MLGNQYAVIPMLCHLLAQLELIWAGFALFADHASYEYHHGDVLVPRYVRTRTVSKPNTYHIQRRLGGSGVHCSRPALLLYSRCTVRHVAALLGTYCCSCVTNPAVLQISNVHDTRPAILLQSAARSSNSGVLLSCSAKNEVRLFSFSGKQLASVDAAGLHNHMAAISANGRFLAAATFTSDVKVGQPQREACQHLWCCPCLCMYYIYT